eukprot:snap_masked-scaffold_1-processed-gene-15.25-mRNA-1 protein AED:1.00 eAED:1.00 QI:0/0/0/0/1/1/2/0/103
MDLINFVQHLLKISGQQVSKNSTVKEKKRVATWVFKVRPNKFSLILMEILHIKNFSSERIMKFITFPRNVCDGKHLLTSSTYGPQNLFLLGKTAAAVQQRLKL